MHFLFIPGNDMRVSIIPFMHFSERRQMVFIGDSEFHQKSVKKVLNIFFFGI